MIALALFKPKIKVGKISIGTYWLVTLAGAAVLLAAGLVGFGELWQGLTSNEAINPLKILVLFISMTVLSIFLDETGFFRYLANLVLKKTGSNQLKLFTALYAAISILTIFTSNDIIILTFTPFVCYFAKNAKIDPVPYLIMTFIAANTCSMLLIIGNPTNIYLATAQGIDFFAYLKVMALPTLFAFIAAYAVMLPLFWKKLKLPIERNEEEVVIEHKPLLITGLVFLSACTVLLAVSSYIGIEMWIVALAGALGMIAAVLLICAAAKRKPKELGVTVRRAPWELIPFILSMFVIVLSLKTYGVTERLASLLKEDGVVFVYGASSALFANLINNIPMSVLFSSVIQNISGSAVSAQAVYAAIIGSNLGAFLTPVGALAGLMWLQILSAHDIKFSFIRFVKYGFVIGVPVLAAALSGLLIASAWI